MGLRTVGTQQACCWSQKQDNEFESSQCQSNQHQQYLCESVTQAITSCVLAAGREVREQLFSQVAALFHDLDMGMLPISVLLPYLPIPAHNRRDR